MAIFLICGDWRGKDRTQTGEKHGSKKFWPRGPFKFSIKKSNKTACGSHACITWILWHAICEVNASPAF